MLNVKLIKFIFTIILSTLLLTTACASDESKFQKKVESFLKAQDYKGALEYVNGYLKENPEKPFVRRTRVRVLTDQGEMVEAIDEYVRLQAMTKKHDKDLLRDIITGGLKRHESDLFNIFTEALVVWGRDDSLKPVLIPVLNERLKDHNIYVRLYAAIPLAKLDDKNVIPVLKEALINEDHNIRFQAAEALADLGDNEGLPVLKEYLKDEGSYLGSRMNRFRAARALAELGDMSVMPLLQKEALNGWAVRIEAASTLAKLGDKSGIPVLKEALKNEGRPDKRLHAARSLAELGDKSVLPILEDGLKSKSLNDRVVSVVCIYKLL